jgi:ABC-2 type transport system permease protein
MRGFGQLTWVNIKLYLRDPMATFFTLAFPPLLIVVFGAMFGNEPQMAFGSLGSMDLSMPGYTALILGTVGLLGIPITISAYRESGVLRRYKATALRPHTYILADVVANLLMTLLGMVGLVLAGWLLYNVQFDGNVFYVILSVLLSGLGMFSFGYLIASLAPGARSAQVIGMVIFYPMMFLSGAAMPIELLPDSIKKISAFLPLTYVARLLRGMWFGKEWADVTLELAVLGGILILCTALAARFFRWE